MQRVAFSGRQMYARKVSVIAHSRARLHTSACFRQEGGNSGSSSGSDGGVSSASNFLVGMSALINASRTSTTKGLWQMRAQERAEMTSQLNLQRSARTPITPTDECVKPRAPVQHQHFSPAAAQPSPSASSSGSPLAKRTNPFPAVVPLESFWSVSLPFDTDVSLQDDYMRFDGGIRFERVLEDLDAFAGNVAHLHVKQGTQKLAAAHQAAAAQGGATSEVQSPQRLPDYQIVTASVDGIVMNPRMRFPMSQHLAMQGCVTWSGSSSMEIWIEMRIVRDPAQWGRMSLEEKMRTVGRDIEQDEQDVILNAFFLMVARDPATAKAAFVPPINVAALGPQDLFRFKRGEQSAGRRKREAAYSLQRTPPTPDEIGLIHDLLVAHGDGSPAPAASLSDSHSNAQGSVERAHRMSLSALDPPASSVPPVTAAAVVPSTALIRPKLVFMNDTEMASSAMTQPQDRNTNGKIFGGYLMSRAYELARCNAYLFCGANSHPYFVAVDQISFLRPVEIGSIISFRSKICYASGHPDPCFQIRVETLVHDLVNGTIFPSNVFSFTFQSNAVPVRKIVPESYREAIDYLDGKRRREKLSNTLKGQGSIEETKDANVPKQPSATLTDAPQ